MTAETTYCLAKREVLTVVTVTKCIFKSFSIMAGGKYIGGKFNAYLLMRFTWTMPSILS